MNPSVSFMRRTDNGNLEFFITSLSFSSFLAFKCILLSSYISFLFLSFSPSHTIHCETGYFPHPEKAENWLSLPPCPSVIFHLPSAACSILFVTLPFVPDQTIVRHSRLAALNSLAIKTVGFNLLPPFLNQFFLLKVPIPLFC